MSKVVARRSAKTSGLIAPKEQDPEDMILRQMEVRDAAAVFHLGEEVFTSSSFPQLYRTWDPFEVTETLAADAELCLVAEELPKDGEGKGRIVGFLLGSITEKRKREQSCGYVTWVAVAESHQRRGIGTLLVTRMFKLFSEEHITTVIADTPKENYPAIQFLGRLGFGAPVYHVYMSLNISNQPRLQAPSVSGEARTVKLRHMTIDDLSPVYELGEQVYQADKFPNLFRIWSEGEVMELFGSDSEHCMVAEKDGKVVGFVLGTTIEKKRSSWRYGYLVWLGVAPDVQRLGVGRRLFHAFYDLMMDEGCRIMLADTQADNEPARRFFERAGFGSLEQHVYFSKVISEEDRKLAGSSTAVVTAADGRGPSIPTTKVLKMLKFKKSHSHTSTGGMGAIATGPLGLTAGASSSSSASTPRKGKAALLASPVPPAAGDEHREEHEQTPRRGAKRAASTPKSGHAKAAKA